MRVARSILSILVLTLIFAVVFFFLISAFTRNGSGKGKESPGTSFSLPGSAPALSDSFEATAIIRYKDFNANAVIHQDTQACSLSFTSPDTLKDMSVTYGSKGVDLSYKGLSFTFDQDSIPGGAVAQMTMTAIGEAIRGQSEAKVANGTAQYTGTTDAGNFTLTADENGRLLYLSIPQAELEIEFVEYAALP